MTIFTLSMTTSPWTLAKFSFHISWRSCCQRVRRQMCDRQRSDFRILVIVNQVIVAALKKIGLPALRVVYQQKSLVERLQSAKVYCTSLQYCILIGYTNHVTAENKWEYNIAMTYCNTYMFGLWNRSMRDFGSYMHQQFFRQADFLKPQLLLDNLWFQSGFECAKHHDFRTPVSIFSVQHT